MRTKLILEDADCTLNEDDISSCSHFLSLPMKREESKTHLRSGIPSMKFVYPKMKWVWNKETKKSQRLVSCENPCTKSSCGKMFISMLKRIYVHILERPEEHKNGSITIKSVQL